MRDHVRVKQVVVASTHLLDDGGLGSVARAGGFVAPAQDSHVWRVMYVVERVDIAHARPQDPWLIRPLPLRVVMDVVARDQVVTSRQAAVQPPLERDARAAKIEDLTVSHGVVKTDQLDSSATAICHSAARDGDVGHGGTAGRDDR